MSETLGLYVHVPFCEAKCTYCHFAIDPRRPDGDRQERYLRGLLAEMAGAAHGPADTTSPVAGDRTLSSRDRIGEALFTGLRRRDGVDLAAFQARYGADPLLEYAAPLREPFDAGLLELAERRLRLTEKGLLLSNEVFAAFV